jgi:hypothetical protein
MSQSQVSGDDRQWDLVGYFYGDPVVATGPCPVATCGNTPFLTMAMADKLYRRGETFYCPAGHSQSWPGLPKRNKVKEAERAAAKAKSDAEHAAAMREIAERTCPWPTCDGRVLASPRGLRQHMVKAHGAPWASPELDIDEVGQVLNGRDPEDVIR